MTADLQQAQIDKLLALTDTLVDRVERYKQSLLAIDYVLAQSGPTSITRARALVADALGDVDTDDTPPL